MVYRRQPVADEQVRNPACLPAVGATEGGIVTAKVYDFHNTTAEDELLAEFSTKAAAQDVLVYVFFLNHPGVLYSPSQILEYVFKNRVPITSVRRAMSNLTRDGKLTKTDIKRKGIYGRPECCWKLEAFQVEMF